MKACQFSTMEEKLKLTTNKTDLVDQKVTKVIDSNQLNKIHFYEEEINMSLGSTKKMLIKQ